MQQPAAAAPLPLGPDALRRLGKGVSKVLRHERPGESLTVDEIVAAFRHTPQRVDVERVLQEDSVRRRRRFLQSERVDASGWVSYQWRAAP